MNTRLKVKYSYYTILILDTEQPRVNRTKPYEVVWKAMECSRKYYIILHHTSPYWNLCHHEKGMGYCRMFWKVLDDDTRKREMEVSK